MIKLLQHLTISRRFAIVGLIGIILTAAPLGIYLREVGRSIDTVHDEIAAAPRSSTAIPPRKCHGLDHRRGRRSGPTRPGGEGTRRVDGSDQDAHG
jgi:hypothetical protein